MTAAVGRSVFDCARNTNGAPAMAEVVVEMKRLREG
jgi:hypothetical protein